MNKDVKVHTDIMLSVCVCVPDWTWITYNMGYEQRIPFI